MAGQNQIEMAPEAVRDLRIMEKKDLSLGAWFVEGANAAATKTDEFQIVFGEQRGVVRQPGAAGRTERCCEIRSRDAALVIVMPGRAVNRCGDLADEPKGIRREARLFDQIARETNEVGRELVDAAY